MGVPVHRPICVETTAMGAAYLAGLAVGYWKSKDDIKANWGLDREFTSSMEEKKRQEELDGWHRAVKCAMGWEQAK